MTIAKTFAAGLAFALAAAGFGVFSTGGNQYVVDGGGCGAAALCP